jgi:hypothetical protein
LGYRPGIERQNSAPDEESFELSYCIDKLKKTGFSLNGKIENEIDATLVFCQKAFGKPPGLQVSIEPKRGS